MAPAKSVGLHLPLAATIAVDRVTAQGVFLQDNAAGKQRKSELTESVEVESLLSHHVRWLGLRIPKTLKLHYPPS